MKEKIIEPIKAWWAKVDAFLTEHKKTVKTVGLVSLVVTLIAALALTIVGIVQVNKPVSSYESQGTVTMIRLTTPEEEEYSEDEYTLCPVEFESEDGQYSAVITFTIDEWLELGDRTEIDGYLYSEIGGDRYVVLHKEGTDAEIRAAFKNVSADMASYTFIVALAVALVAIAVGIMYFFGKHFTLYEKTWFLGIMILSAIISIIAPEEGLNGVSGIWVMALYLADTFLNILCELLISKQSKWNFIVSVFVEIVEILCCIVLAYRFATMAVTLFFWLPCDIASFINWNKKQDTEDEELTKVRTLKGWQEILLIAGIVVWTIVVGYFLSGLDIATDLFGGNEILATVVCYLDACASAVGIVNGLAILFRFREQWIAWYICSIIEAAINIMAGQWVLLPLKVGYLTNTTYGYIKWSKYIKAHPEVVEEKTFF
jgi:nicotinamide mononucleotide transporter